MQYIIDDEVLMSGYKGVTREVYAFLKAGNVNPGPVKLARLLGYSKRQIINALLIISGKGAKNAPNGAKNAPNGAKNAPNGAKNAPQPIAEMAEKGAKIAPNGAKNAPIDECGEEGAKNAPNGAKNAPQHKESNTEKVIYINNNISLTEDNKEKKEILKKEKKAPSFRAALLAVGIQGETISQWLEVRMRKKMVNTELALKKILSQIEIVRARGYSPEDAIQFAVIKSWGGFEAQWYFNEIEKQNNKSLRHEHRLQNNISANLRVPERRDYAAESTL